jgi:fumarate reductase flavoprotein subunit
MRDEKESKTISRRDFVKGAAFSAAVAAGGGLLTGCSSAEEPVECPPCPTQEPAAAAAEEAAAVCTEKVYSFEIAPDSVPDSEIVETVEADVVVVGAGVAGMTAAVSAAEAGANTVLIEKGVSYTAHGLHNAAIGSRMQKEAGIEIDRDEAVKAIMSFGSYRGDQKLVQIWADKSGEIMDWLLDMAEEAGQEVVLDPTTKEWFFANFPTIHTFMPNNQADLLAMLESKAKELGVDIRYETPAAQLIREGQGRVTGVIAKNFDGEYVKLNAGKAVIMCTGGYGHNSEMMEKYTDWRSNTIPNIYMPAQNTGDGHAMGLWIGAAVDDMPHCTMRFDMPTSGAFFNLARQPWMYVNLNGERFMNEDLPWALEASQMMQQPGGVCYSVWDAKYQDEYPKFKSQCCKNMGAPTFLWNESMMEAGLEEGYLFKADTLEELAEAIGVPADTFAATAARYTELAQGGKDLDFGKHPDRLTTLEQAPYYAMQMGAVTLVTLGGLKINTDLQVLDVDGSVIPGLYAAGNVSGCFFGDEYPTTSPGLSHGRAWTFGYLAGQSAASETA